MRFLFIGSRTLPLAMRVQDEGHKAYLLNDGPEGQGLVDKADQNFVDNLPADMAVIDGPGYGRAVDSCVSRGIKVIGSSRLTDAISESPAYHRAFVRSLGYDMAAPSPNDLVAEGWFNGSHICQPVGLGKVDWHLMEGNLGPDIGGCGAWVELKRDSEVFGPVEKMLRKHSYRGPVVMRLAPTGEVVLMSFHFNWTTSVAYLDSLITPIGDVLRIVANGSSDEFEAKGVGKTISILLSMPPFPYGNKGTFGIPIQLQNGAWPHFWCGDLLSNDGRVITAGTKGIIGWVTASAKDVLDARKRAFRTINRLRGQVPGIQYRRDVGKVI